MALDDVVGTFVLMDCMLVNNTARVAGGGVYDMARS